MVLGVILIVRNVLTYLLLGITCTIVLTLSLFASVAYAQPEDDLYLLTFGTKEATSTQLLTVPLQVNDRDRGEIQIQLKGKKDETQIKVNDLLKQVEGILLRDVVAVLERDIIGEEWVNLGRLLKHNMIARYDSRVLELHLDIPTELRKTEIISFRPSYSNFTSDNLERPRNFSAYVNVFSDLQYVWNGGQAGRQPANIVFDVALNHSDWVFEGEAFYREGNDTPLQRGNVRIVRDMVEHSVRVAAIDVALPAVDFQNALAVGGIVIAKTFQLRPDLIIYPTSQKHFLLEHPSTVEIVVNSQPYRTLHLPEGSYNLRDFPVVRGVNDVLILIKDDFGRERELAFPFISETQLLAVGLHDYGYGFGFPSTIGVGEYDTRRLFVSGFHRLGLHENLTVGLNAQGDKDKQLLGSEVSFASSLGSVSLRGAFSRDVKDGYGFASSLNYSYQAPINSSNWKRIWDLSAIYKSRDFTPPGGVAVSSPLSLDITWVVSQPLGDDMYVSVRGGFQRSHTEKSDANNISLLFRKNISRSLSWDIALAREGDFTQDVDYRVSTNVRFSFDGGRQALQTSYDSRDQSKRLSWDRRSELNYGGFDIGVDVISKRNDTALTGGLQHQGNRVQATLRHDLEWPHDNEQSQIMRTSVSVASAIAYAGGHFGLSRPIRDSFAIVVPHTSIGDQTIGVNPFSNSYQFESGLLGPAVVPDLISYQSRTLTIDVPELPLGYNLDNDLPKLLPTFRSGTIVSLGGDENVLLAGVLNIREGEPASLEAGKLIALDDSQQENRPFFTNRKGRFRVDRLKPGKYQLQLFSFPKDRLTIEIPEGTAGIYDIGNIGIH